MKNLRKNIAKLFLILLGFGSDSIEYRRFVGGKWYCFYFHTIHDKVAVWLQGEPKKEVLAGSVTAIEDWK